MQSALSLNHVDYSYHMDTGEVKALENISFYVKKGEFVAIVGPSGCGKSTLLNLIANLLTTSRGSIRINGRNSSLVRETIGYMLQKDHLLEYRTIYRNITLGLEIQKKLSSDNISRINTMLDQYGLWDFRNSYPKELSVPL